MAEYGEAITWENGHAVERNLSAVVNYVEPIEALRDRRTDNTSVGRVCVPELTGSR